MHTGCGNMSNASARRTRYLYGAMLTLALSGSIGTASAQERDKPEPDLSTLDLEQLLQVEIVYAASKREQKLREAPSAVSVVTSEEIRQHGFRTLADVLRSLQIGRASCRER